MRRAYNTYVEISGDREVRVYSPPPRFFFFSFFIIISSACEADARTSLHAPFIRTIELGNSYCTGWLDCYWWWFFFLRFFLLSLGIAENYHANFRNFLILRCRDLKLFREIATGNLGFFHTSRFNWKNFPTMVCCERKSWALNKFSTSLLIFTASM